MFLGGDLARLDPALPQPLIVAMLLQIQSQSPVANPSNTRCCIANNDTEWVAATNSVFLSPECAPRRGGLGVFSPHENGPGKMCDQRNPNKSPPHGTTIMHRLRSRTGGINPGPCSDAFADASAPALGVRSMNFLTCPLCCFVSSVSRMPSLHFDQ